MKPSDPAASASQQKLTPKQERFCLAYIETGNASEAYRLTYNAENMKPETVNRKATELLDNGKITARLAVLQAVHRQRHDVTVDSLVAELDDARALAMKVETPSAAVAATMGKGKLLGLIVDKADVNNKLLVEAPETAAVIKALLEALPELSAGLGLRPVNGVAALVSMPAEPAEGQPT